jgi:hypothetical protein
LDVQTAGTALDRLSEGYEPSWDIDRRVGARGEAQAASHIDAYAAGRVEVKTDERAATTGNVYVEYECRRADGWHASGIATTRADYWTFVVGGLMLTVHTDTLKRITRSHYCSRRRECTRGSHPTKGVLVPLTDLVAQAVADAVPS